MLSILSHVEEICSIVVEISLRQNSWHRLSLTYIGHHCLTHHNSKAAKKDPFRMTLMNDIQALMGKLVSSQINIKILYIYDITTLET